MTPERLAALKEQQRLFGLDKTLPEICLDLRMGTNGSSDAWKPEDVAETVAMLKSRLVTWANGLERDRRFDDAVKELVTATIKEVEIAS